MDDSLERTHGMMRDMVDENFVMVRACPRLFRDSTLATACCLFRPRNVPLPFLVVELNFEQKTTATECKYKPHTRYLFVFDFDV